MEDKGYIKWDLDLSLSSNFARLSNLIPCESELEDPCYGEDFSLLPKKNLAILLYRLLSPLQKLNSDALSKALIVHNKVEIVWSDYGSEYWGADSTGKVSKLHIHVFLVLCMQEGIEVTDEEGFWDSRQKASNALIKKREGYVVVCNKVMERLEIIANILKTTDSLDTLNTEQLAKKLVEYKDLGVEYKELSVLFKDSTNFIRLLDKKLDLYLSNFKEYETFITANKNQD